MSAHRRQFVIDAPIGAVWELLGDPSTQPQWWPVVVEVNGDSFEMGSTFRQVTRSLIGTEETTFLVERLEDLREIRMRCLDTGTYSRWLLVEGQGATVVDAELGIEPLSLGYRIFDATLARPVFRRWLDQAQAGLREALER